MIAHTKILHYPSTSLIPSLYFLFTSLLALSTTHAQSISPVPVTYPGSARTPTRFFILSGATKMDSLNFPLVFSPQFFYLDLSTSWDTTTVASPAWVQLRQGPQSGIFPGTASADSKDLFFFKIPGTEPVYQFSLDTGNWSPAKQAVSRFAAAGNQGLGAVTDPGTDLVYVAGGYTDPNYGTLDVWNWKTGNVTSTLLPDPNLTGVFADRTYYTAAWCKARGSILYWGGYSKFTRTNTVSELKPPNEWSTLPTTGFIPSNRADHCMAINDNATKLIVFGGRLETNVVSNEVFILNIATGIWTKGTPSTLPRIYSACTIAGDQFIVWGGLTNLTHIASAEVLVYNIERDTWVTEYTPTAAYQNVVVPPIPGAVGARPSTSANVSGVSPPAPSNPTKGGGTSASDDSNAGGSNIGGIVGGVVGGVVSAGAVVLFIYRRRKQHQRQEKNIVPFKSITETGNKSKLVTPGAGGRGGGDAGDQEPQTFNAAVVQNQGPQEAVYGSAAAGYQDLQGLSASGDIEFHLRRKELENQQRQIELKRELLALEEQGQRFRPPGSQYQQEQQQYQQHMPVQYPMAMGVSQYPVTTVQTVQTLPVTTSSTSMGRQYYPNEPIYAPHDAGPVIFVPTGSPSPHSSPSGLNVHNNAVPGANINNNIQSIGGEGGKGKTNNPHTII